MGAKKLSADDKRALADRDYWVAMERNGWRCIGFTYRDSATFCKGPACCEINWKVLEALGLRDPLS